MRVRLLAASVAVLLAAGALLAGAAPRAGAARSVRRPLQVRLASLTQHGLQLTWSVELTQPFAPAALRHDGRALCLLIERPRSARVTGRLCLAGPRSGHLSAQLDYQSVTRRGLVPARLVAATLARSGPRELSATFAPASAGLGFTATRWQVISTLSKPGCAPAGPDGSGCLTLFPSRPALVRLHVPRLVGCVPRGAPFVYSGAAAAKMIALTFDDGPWSDTAAFLSLLERYRVPATFFQIGDQVGEYGQGGVIDRRMLADGDMIGDHTWSHADVSAGGPFAASQISRAAAAIKQATRGFEPCLFRAPYGAASGGLISLARSIGFTTIQWNIDPRDWARPGTAAIYDNVIANARPGAIVEEHDGGGDRSETLAALPTEIQNLRRRGYRFVTVTQLLGMALVYQ